MTVPRHAAWVAGAICPGAATIRLPSSGRSAPARSSALTIARTGPSVVPGACVVVNVVPVGTKIRTLAVGSSFGSSVALTVAEVPACRTSSFAVVYAA